MDNGICHRTVEPQPYFTAIEFWFPVKNLLVTELALIDALIKIVQRQIDGVVWQPDDLAFPHLPGCNCFEPLAEDPVFVELANNPHQDASRSLRSSDSQRS